MELILNEGNEDLNKLFGLINLNIANTYFMKKEYMEAKSYYESAKLNAKS